jgi:leucyl-tRNA synthetase
MPKRIQLPPVSVEMRHRARELRANLTDAEIYLCSMLKSKQLGEKFLRQRVIGNYICDFASLEAGIVI